MNPFVEALERAEKLIGEKDAEIAQLRNDYQRVAAAHDLLHEERDELRDTNERLLAYQTLARRENSRLHKLIDVIRARDQAHNLFNCISGGWIRQQIAQTFRDEQSPPEGDNDPNGNRDLAREIDGS